MNSASFQTMLIKLFFVGLFATVFGQVAEKGNLDDLIGNVFNEGRTDVVNEKVRRK